jgi:type I restriction enzyme R subunit
VGDEVELQYYRLERVYAGAIEVRRVTPNPSRAPRMWVRQGKREKAPLSEIIEVLNERFGTHFTEEDASFSSRSGEAAKTIRSSSGAGQLWISSNWASAS